MLRSRSAMGVCPSVIVHDLHVVGTAGAPDEADPELVVDTDAVLAGALPSQGSEPVPRWHSQVVQALRVVEHPELPPSDVLDVTRQLPRNLAPPDPFSLRRPEGADHAAIITRGVIRLKPEAQGQPPVPA